MTEPVVTSTSTGLLRLSKPGSAYPCAEIGKINTERGYHNFMGRIRETFDDWEPEWQDSAGLWEWVNTKRAELGLKPVSEFPPARTDPFAAYHDPVVYFVRVGDVIKIGTTTNLRNRVVGLGLTMGDVLAAEPGGKALEEELHREFADLCASGEWFHAEPRLLAYIDRVRGRPTRIRPRSYGRSSRRP